MFQGRIFLIWLKVLCLGRPQQRTIWNSRVLSPNVMNSFNTDKKQWHTLDNHTRNLLSCHEPKLYNCVELEVVVCWQMFNNWLSMKPELLICRVCPLCSVNSLTMADFKLPIWLSLNSELGRGVNNRLSWASVIRPQHITGWKSPLIAKGLQ